MAALLIEDLLDLPEQVSRGNFVLRNIDRQTSHAHRSSLLWGVPPSRRSLSLTGAGRI